MKIRKILGVLLLALTLLILQKIIFANGSAGNTNSDSQNKYTFLIR